MFRIIRILYNDIKRVGYGRTTLQAFGNSKASIRPIRASRSARFEPLASRHTRLSIRGMRNSRMEACESFA